ncbi:hypothetical protein [Dactylosporangium sp. CA-233914]
MKVLLGERLGQFSPGRFAAGSGLASGFAAARILGWGDDGQR